MSMIDSQEDRASRGAPGYATIEIGHRRTRTGIVVQIDTTSSQIVRHVVDLAFDLAGQQPRLAVHDPGWWAVLVGWAGLRATGNASVQRFVVPGRVHAVLVVEPSRMLEKHPAWPLLRLSASTQWQDCRGETCLRHGPADVELEAYGHERHIDLDVPTLRGMFDQGVIEWEPGPIRGGRRPLRPAGAS